MSEPEPKPEPELRPKLLPWTRVVRTDIELPTQDDVADLRLQAVVDAAHESVYLMIWECKEYTGAESRLMWIRLINLMLSSFLIECNYQVVEERNHRLHPEPGDQR